MDELAFEIERISHGEPAIGPRLELALRVRARRPIANAMLVAQVRIEPRRREYAPLERARLEPLFGGAELGSRGLESLLWTQSTILLGAFDAETEARVELPCPADLDHAIGKLAHALDEGGVPIAIGLRGTVFARGVQGLEALPISQRRDLASAVPIALLREAIDRARGDRCGLWVRPELADRLRRYGLMHALASDDAALEQLLRESAS